MCIGPFSSNDPFVYADIASERPTVTSDRGHEPPTVLLRGHEPPTVLLRQIEVICKRSPINKIIDLCGWQTPQDNQHHGNMERSYGPGEVIWTWRGHMERSHGEVIWTWRGHMERPYGHGEVIWTWSYGHGEVIWTWRGHMDMERSYGEVIWTWRGHMERSYGHGEVISQKCALIKDISSASIIQLVLILAWVPMQLFFFLNNFCAHLRR